MSSATTNHFPHICVFEGTNATTEWVCRRCGNRRVITGWRRVRA